MVKINLDFRALSRKFSTLVILFLIFLTLTYTLLNYDLSSTQDGYRDYSKSNQKVDEGTIETSSLWGFVNLTNNIEINNTQHYQNETIPIKGELLDGLLNGIQGFLMEIYIDGIKYSNFSDTTDSNGDFTINFVIPLSLNIYASHIIEADVQNPLGTVELLNYFTIFTNTTSHFDVYTQNMPQPAGGFYEIPSYLRYTNNSGIPFQQIQSSWYNETLDQIIPPKPTHITNNDGSFNHINIPDNDSSNVVYLNLTYIGNNPYINATSKLISIKVFRNITCKWDTVGSTTEGNQITISGQIFARNNSTLRINSTEVRLRMSGASIGTAITDVNGTFSLPYSIPSGIVGSNTIEVELLYFPIINSNKSHIINIAAAPIPESEPINGGGSSDTPPPFQNFFLVLIPIIIGIVAGFAIFGYFYLKKQKEESMLVKLPLEDRIRNLKILKETGRMEESLSYLFQSIYMELINGKYGRRIKENETIRDFAIISVKNLNLNPATIYPFIQKVEEIIYARPFIINDKDFYETVELFSPIYFELTGYNFVLNF